MTLDPSLPPAASAQESVFSRLAALERKAEAQEKQTSITFLGSRTDLAAGIGPRARFGVLTDGTFGAERWTSAGVRQLPTWS